MKNEEWLAVRASIVLTSLTSLTPLTPKKYITMNKKDFLETVVKVIVAALTAFLTAITTTSCMGHGPF